MWNSFRSVSFWSAQFKTQRKTYAAIISLSLAAYVLHNELNVRSQNLAEALRQHKKDLGDSMTAMSETPTKNDVMRMLKDTKSRTTREKLEAAYDAATETHKIGFPSSISSLTSPDHKSQDVTP